MTSKKVTIKANALTVFHEEAVEETKVLLIFSFLL